MKGIIVMIRQKHILFGILIVLAVSMFFFACSMQKELFTNEEKTTVNTTTATSAQLTEETTTLPVKQEGDSYINQNKIDVEYQSALETVRNLKKYEITQDYAQRWKREMEDNLQNLMGKLSTDDKNLLTTAQNSWEAYAKNELKLAYAYADILSLDSDAKMNHNAKAYYDIYRERAIELYQYRQAITEKFGDVPYYETTAENE